IALPHLASPALVECELGIDKIAMVLDQPVEPVVRAAAFFISGERDDDIAIWLVAFALITDQVRRPGGHLRFVVGSAAAVVISVFFGEDKRIQARVFPLRFDDIGVSK